jgi:hypothetical protein
MYEEEYERINYIIEKLLREANSKEIFLVDKNGQLISGVGETERLTQLHWPLLLREISQPPGTGETDRRKRVFHSFPRRRKRQPAHLHRRRPRYPGSAIRQSLIAWPG